MPVRSGYAWLSSNCLYIDMLPLGQNSKRACQIATLSISLVLPDRVTADPQSGTPPPPPAAPSKAASKAAFEALVPPIEKVTRRDGIAVDSARRVAVEPPRISSPPQTQKPLREEPQGIGSRVAAWLSKDFTSFNTPMEAARAIGLSLRSVAGGLLAISAASTRLS